MGKRDKRRRRAKSANKAGPTSGRVRATTQPAQPPPRERLRKGKTIRIGQVEDLPGARQLRCVVDGDGVVVAVFEGDERREPHLFLSVPAESRVPGSSFDEGEFSRVTDSYYVLSPWHDGEYTCLVLTIDCLRRGEDHELLVFKDL